MGAMKYYLMFFLKNFMVKCKTIRGNRVIYKLRILFKNTNKIFTFYFL